MTPPLHVRWLGRVPYGEGDVLQRALHERSADDYLLLLEHDPVYTMGSRADPSHVLTPPAVVGADLVHCDRGGDVTYHGPGQLVGYPIITLPGWADGLRDVVGYVRRLEAVLIGALADLGVEAERRARLTGVWVGDEKIAAIGVRVARGRTRHGFALNVAPDLTMFSHIVPCGIADKGVTSLAALLGTAPPLNEVLDRVVARFASEFEYTAIDRQAVTGPAGAAETVQAASAGSNGRRLIARLAAADVMASADVEDAPRPAWMRVRARLGPEFRGVQRLMRTLDLHTVCEEAGCPNIYECWADRTATVMILGDRCTRACGFCLVQTGRPTGVDVDEPGRVAEAVAALGLAHVVITSVARDDVPDGGASIFAETVRAIRGRTPGTQIELLIPDCKGNSDALASIFDERPDVLNHNLETVARLQRALRPNAGYSRSLSVLARAKDDGLTTKSGIILGLGEDPAEVRGAIADLRHVGVDILTLGQYLRPSAQHAPVVRWWTPEEFDELGRHARDLGFAHVEAGPLVRSSYHARRAADAASAPAGASLAV
ncbi:MAG TPA: lipoyl synthase [Acidimicrobiia bacterium]